MKELKTLKQRLAQLKNHEDQDEAITIRVKNMVEMYEHFVEIFERLEKLENPQKKSVLLIPNNS